MATLPNRAVTMRRLQRRGVLIMLLILVPLSVAGQETEPPVVPIIISGMVVDAMGRSLKAVEMTVIEYRREAETLESISTRRHLQVDGAFDVQCVDCSDLRLRFQASGFYPKRVAFELTEEEIKTLVLGAPPPDFAIVRRGISVEMESSGQPVRLERVNLTLDHGRDGPIQVLARDEDRPAMNFYSEVIRKRQGAGTGGGPAMIALMAEPEQFEALVEKADGPRPETKALAVAILEFSGAETGVFPVDVVGGGPRHNYRGLKEAPESGYLPQLVLDTNTGEEQYFYCRMGGLFGKGRVTDVRVGWDRNSNPTLEVGLEIYLNRGGGRNLNALEY